MLLSVEMVSRSVQPLQKRHTRVAFSCGDESLDRYFSQQAMQDLRRKAAAAFVFTDTNSLEILGFYTLSAETILPGDLPEEIARKLPRYPRLPATLIGRLAVAKQHHGEGIGEFLLMNALERSFKSAETVGSIAVVVEAISDRARRFYLNYDFIPFHDSGNRLFLPMGTIAKLFC
jgi:GNAT superfamily N-acetyltransferase